MYNVSQAKSVTRKVLWRFLGFLETHFHVGLYELAIAIESTIILWY